MLLGPKNFRPGQRDDNARLQKLEKQVAVLTAKLALIEDTICKSVAVLMEDNKSVAAMVEGAQPKRGPGRPRKDEQAAA